MSFNKMMGAGIATALTLGNPILKMENNKFAIESTTANAQPAPKKAESVKKYLKDTRKKGNTAYPIVTMVKGETYHCSAGDKTSKNVIKNKMICDTVRIGTPSYDPINAQDLKTSERYNVLLDCKGGKLKTTNEYDEGYLTRTLAKCN